MNEDKLPIGIIFSAKEVGVLVTQYRKQQALTQVELAGLAQTGTRFISELENGKGTVQFDKVTHILNLLGLEMVIRERNVK